MDNKLTMAFFFMKIISPSKPSGSMAKNMQYLHMFYLTNIATDKKEISYNLNIHNYHSRSDVLKMAFVPHCNVTWTGLRPSVTKL